MAVAATEQTEESGESLREFALRVYAQEAVARACLDAQERYGMDVNLLLFGAWLAERGVVLSALDAASAEAQCKGWRESVIVPLRRQRRAWAGVADLVSEYEALKRLEVSAELEQLAMLAALATEDLLGNNASRRLDPAECLAENCAAICEHYRQPKNALNALSVAILPGPR